MNILNNPWVIGIGGGVISSLIVFFVTQYISRKKANENICKKLKWPITIFCILYGLLL